MLDFKRVGIPERKNDSEDFLHELSDDGDESDENESSGSDMTNDTREGKKEAMVAILDYALSGDASRCQLHDTPNDVWGALLFVLAKNIPDLSHGTKKPGQIFEVVITFVITAINMALQIGCLYWVREFLTKPAVLKSQSNYRYFHATCFDQGVFNYTKWHALKEAEKIPICNTGLACPTFLYCMLGLLWWTVVAELRETFAIQRHIRAIPSLPPSMSQKDMVIEKNEEDGTTFFLLVALNNRTRLLIYTLVVVPKYIIGLSVLYICARWVVASANFQDLILNCLSATFILGIDETLFKAVFPEPFKEGICSSKWVIPTERHLFTTHTLIEKEEMRETQRVRGAVRSFIIMLIAILSFFLYINYFQAVLPGYEFDLHDHCIRFWYEQEPCRNATCFPKS